MKLKNRSALHKLLTASFKSEEIRLLGRELGIAPFLAEGAPSAQAAYALIQSCDMQGRTDELLRVLKEHRPAADWSQIEDSDSEGDASQTVSQPDLKALRLGISETFDWKELQVACFDLGIEFQNLAGDTLDLKVVELIRYGTRHGMLQDIVGYVRKARPNLKLEQKTELLLPSAWTVEEREKHRSTLRDARKDIYLVHALRPSPNRSGWYDILIYLVPHQKADLLVVKAAEFFLGKMWENRIFRASVQDDFVGIAISAYGPVLCTCRVLFTDGSDVLLERYIDLEMAEAYKIAVSRKGE
jgi:Effector-associated domain 7/prokaryotic YEATS domain